MPVPKVKTVQNRRVTSPLASKVRDPQTQELARTEIELDRELLKWRRMLDVAKQAKNYESKGEDDEQVVQLTNSWRDAAQKAASELFEQASQRVEQMGGMEEFVRRQKEKDEFQHAVSGGYEEDAIDYNSLSAEEKERFDALKQEYEEEMAKSRSQQDDGEDSPKEFTLKYMLQSLKMDYKVIFPDSEPEES